MPIAAVRVSSPAKVSAPIFPAAEDQILIRKVAEPGGWLSNMIPHPVEYEGQKWWHCEALFQALRYAADDAEARDEIRRWKSPMRAKMVAYASVPAVKAFAKSRAASQVDCQCRKANCGRLQFARSPRQ